MTVPVSAANPAADGPCNAVSQQLMHVAAAEGPLEAPLVVGLQPVALVDHAARVSTAFMDSIPGERGGSVRVRTSLCPLEREVVVPLQLASAAWLLCIILQGGLWNADISGAPQGATPCRCAPLPLLRVPCLQVSPEALAQLLAGVRACPASTAEGHSIRTLAGGSVANTLRGLASGFGVRAAMLGAAGDDDLGHMYAAAALDSAVTGVTSNVSHLPGPTSLIKAPAPSLVECCASFGWPRQNHMCLGALVGCIGTLRKIVACEVEHPCSACQVCDEHGRGGRAAAPPPEKSRAHRAGEASARKLSAGPSVEYVPAGDQLFVWATQPLSQRWGPPSFLISGARLEFAASERPPSPDVAGCLG